MFSYIGEKVRLLAASFNSDADNVMVQYTDPLLTTTTTSARRLLLHMLPHVVDVSTERPGDMLLSMGKDTAGLTIGTLSRGRTAKRMVSEVFTPSAWGLGELSVRNINIPYENSQASKWPPLDPRLKDHRPGSASVSNLHPRQENRRSGGTGGRAQTPRKR